MTEEIYSVSDINNYVRGRMTEDPILRRVNIRGEITDFRPYAASGHLYYALKDAAGKIACVMYRSAAQTLKFRPENGVKVVATGQVTLYVPNGSYQLQVTSMRREGQGELYERFLQMKARLEMEGLFDQIHKKPIPFKVKTIGVATSLNGAALRDIVRVTHDRNPHVEIIVAPCAVQGAGAELEIARSVRMLDRTGRCDVILVGRGGGSLEDLWAFNEEAVARAVYECVTPVISCVGHETDFSICDFAADQRAATPTNAAEIAVTELKILTDNLDYLKSRLLTSITHGQKNRRALLERVIASPAFRDPSKWLIESRRAELMRIKEALDKQPGAIMTKRRDEVEKLARLLENLNPDNIKKRGYACVRRADTYIGSVSTLESGQTVTIELCDGAFDAPVNDIRRNENA